MVFFLLDFDHVRLRLVFSEEQYSWHHVVAKRDGLE